MQTDEYERMYNSENALWWYVGLRHFLKQELQRLPKTQKDRRILDVGCGTGRNLQLYSEFGGSIGIDFSNDALRYCQFRGLERIVRGSAWQLPFPDKSFDIISCMDVLGHSSIVDENAVLKEFLRVLRPGGVALFHVSALECLRGQHDEVIMFSRRYTKPSLVQVLQKSGFQIMRITYRNSFFLPPLLVHRQLSRLTRSAKRHAESDVKLPLPGINIMMTLACKLENRATRVLNMPIGSSLYCLAQRPGEVQ